MVVSEYMTSDVVNVEIPGNRDDVLKILKRTGISGVPVLKEGKLVGIITRKDLLRKAEETQLGLLMTPDPVIIAPDAPLSEAAKLLAAHNIRRLPVVEDGQLTGLISTADLVHAIATMRIKQEIKDRYTSQTFALWEETPLPVVGRVMEISGFEAIPILDADSSSRVSSPNVTLYGILRLKIRSKSRISRTERTMTNGHGRASGICILSVTGYQRSSFHRDL